MSFDVLRSFRNDRRFLARYYRISTIVLVLLNAALYTARAEQFGWSILLWVACMLPLFISSFSGVLLACACTSMVWMFSTGAAMASSDWLLVPLGVYLGALNVPLIHNCAHGSWRPRWLNHCLGELFSLQILSGFPGFVILHLTHHQYPDDPVKDPHPNGELTYWQYLRGLKRALGAAYRRIYFERWGDSPESRKDWSEFQRLLPLGRGLRALLFLLVLGPKGFVLFFIPMFITNQIAYAHINYYTHAHHADGQPEIVNLNHGAYRWLNFFLLGIYFHRNHHRYPKVFNPKHLPAQS